jgi:hypothetical protein
MLHIIAPEFFIGLYKNSYNIYDLSIEEDEIDCCVFVLYSKKTGGGG